MKNVCFIAAAFITALVCVHASSAVEFQCCCRMDCLWKYTIMNTACREHDNSSGTVVTTVDQCTDMPWEGQATCEHFLYAQAKCVELTKETAEQQVAEIFDAICGEAYLGPVTTLTVEGTTDTCHMTLVGCATAYLLGAHDPRLDILRQFSDEILSASPAI